MAEWKDPDESDAARYWITVDLVGGGTAIIDSLSVLAMATDRNAATTTQVFIEGGKSFHADMAILDVMALMTEVNEAGD